MALWHNDEEILEIRQAHPKTDLPHKHTSLTL